MILNNKRKYFIAYTFIFAILTALVFFFYYGNGRSLVNINGDGFRQYYRALVYYANVLKGVFTSLVSEHRLIIPQWDFSIGEGNDLLNTFHYYGAGDVINLFSMFVPSDKMYLFYDASIALRIYLSGIAFSLFCFYFKKNNYDDILLGTVIYSFSGFALLSLSGHILFLNAPLYLPLIILGAEKIIRKEKPFFFSMAIMLSALASFYFFYMIAIMTVVYVLVRLIFIKYSTKEKLEAFVKIALYSVLGLMMSAIISLPYMYISLGSSRLGNGVDTPALYSLSYYLTMARSLVFSYGDLFGNYSLFIIPSLILLFLEKGRTELKVLVLLSAVFLAIPFFGKVFNGFMYATDRWEFALCLINSYIIVEMMDTLRNTSRNKLLILFAVLIAYICGCMLMDMDQKMIYILYVLASVGVLVTYLVIKNNNLRNIAGIGAVVACLALSIFYRNSPMYWNYAHNGAKFAKVENVISGQAAAVMEIGDESFRYTTNEADTNSSIHTGKSTTQAYWSMPNDNVVAFRKYLGLSDHNNHHYDFYDDRLALNALSSVKYYIQENEHKMPYGYSPVKSFEERSVYKNDNALELLSFYKNTVDENEWLKMDILNRQVSLLECAVINGNTTKTPDIKTKEYTYSLSSDQNIETDKNHITVKNNGSIHIEFNADDEAEYYFVIDGLESDISSNILVHDLLGNTKILYYKCSTHNAYPDRHDFVMCLGVVEAGLYSFDVDFPNEGRFDYSDIRIMSVPVKEQLESIDRLRNINVTSIDVQINEINASFKANEKGIVCLSVPYAKGWKAYVDGKKADIIRTNIMYMGIEMSEGEHKVEFRYETPFLTAGTLISALSIGTWLFLLKRSNKRI